jgi:hypothetical protein
VVAPAASSRTMWMTSFTSGLADGGGRRVDARMRALGQPEEEETTARRWFPRVDSSFGSVLSDGERFKGREGLSHKTLTRGVRFFTKKCRVTGSLR